MAFSADEVRVLRRALAQALYPALPDDRLQPPGPSAALWAEDVQDALRLTESIDEAVREGGRLRSFMLADLARYRYALPGSAPGYLERLEDAVTDGYLPTPEDLSALRSLSRQPCGHTERARRSRLAGRCHALAEAEVRERLSLASGQRHLTAVPSPATEPLPAFTLGGRVPMSSSPRPPAPGEQPQPRRMPTPAELFGRRPKARPQPQPPAPEDEETELATGTG
ncbi:hypothetical protein [Streptomyces sp. NRRL B-24484]|uniref:hypothetical protein n=1 Tax=Streptomyces sp. NRRL B-24484 TaxID=1463833 RepID=UPI001F1E3CFE|nr:hypothetical protein [Streptomyces sp. NRRL B-24484]